MTSSVATEAFHMVNGMKESCSSESSRPSSSKEAADNSVFTISVEFCGGLEQLTENKTKELQLRFVRRKKGNEQTRPFSCSSSGADRSQVKSESVNSSIAGSPHLCCGGDSAAAGTTAKEASKSHTEIDVPGADAAGRRDDQDEAEESVPLYQVIGFVSSFVLSERPDMFANPYEGAIVDATAAGAQRQHEDGEDGEITYPIDYLLPGGFSPPMQLRPGVLALINDVDTEVLGGMEAPVYSSDCVTFISTLHGG